MEGGLRGEWGYTVYYIYNILFIVPYYITIMWFIIYSIIYSHILFYSINGGRPPT